jgi:hypothetical protein
MLLKKKTVFLSRRLSLFLQKYSNNDYKEYILNDEVEKNKLFLLLRKLNIRNIIPHGVHLDYVDIYNELNDISNYIIGTYDNTLMIYAFIERWTTSNRKIIIQI